MVGCLAVFRGRSPEVFDLSTPRVCSLPEGYGLAFRVHFQREERVVQAMLKAERPSQLRNFSATPAETAQIRGPAHKAHRVIHRFCGHSARSLAPGPVPNSVASSGRGKYEIFVTRRRNRASDIASRRHRVYISIAQVRRR